MRSCLCGVCAVYFAGDSGDQLGQPAEKWSGEQRGRFEAAYGGAADDDGVLLSESCRSGAGGREAGEAGHDALQFGVVGDALKS